MIKNKVILINPAVQYQQPLSYGLYPNTAIMVLATILNKAGFNVRIIDGKYQKRDEVIKSILEEIDESLIFIGFSVMTIQLPWAYYVSQIIKKKRPSAKIVWGGVHPTLFPEQTVEDAAVDIVAVNDAANTIIPLAQRLSEDADLSDLPGICYKNNNGIIKTSLDQKQDDFNSIPFIDFPLIGHKIYSKDNAIANEEFYEGRYKSMKTYPVLTALGCAYKCTFCINVILKRKYCFRKAGEIMERIKFLQKDYGADFIQPLDENFFINRRRTFEFLDLLEKDNIRIKWRPQGRADYFNESYLNLETAKRLDRAGMIVVAMGVESASQDMLDKLKKNLKVEQIIKAAEILSKTNIVPKMNFMVGLPGESEKEIKDTYRLAAKIRRMVPKSCVTISPFRPYPGSPLYEQIISEYDYMPPTNLKDWAKMSEKELIEGIGYESFDNYKWIANPKRLKDMQYVYSRITWYMPQKYNKLSGRIRDWISFMRFKFGFFCFVSVEKAFFGGLAKIRNVAGKVFNFSA